MVSLDVVKLYIYFDPLRGQKETFFKGRHIQSCDYERFDGFFR